jgi:mRNA interferase MazF
VNPRPFRGDVWQTRLDPVVGHEQAGTRPAVVVSADRFNQGWSGLVVVVPVTRTERPNPFHVAVDPPEGGLTNRSFVKCEDVRSVSVDRLIRRWGAVSPATLAAIVDRLRLLLEL